MKQFYSAIILSFILTAVAVGFGVSADAFNQPVVSDSRIKTLVYNPNEVFRIVTNYGFQSNIEFGHNEHIETISIGDQEGWQVIPSDTHLFIRALTEVAHTNMTVITNKRTYQFDLFARSMSDIPDEELAYVIRFYYPEDNFDNRTNPSSPVGGEAASFPSQPSAGQQYNYNYTLSGPQSIAPIRVYDDGRRTYFQFASAGFRPQIFSVTPTGTEAPVTGEIQNDIIAIDAVGTNFTIKSDGQVVCVFNETRKNGF